MGIEGFRGSGQWKTQKPFENVAFSHFWAMKLIKKVKINSKYRRYHDQAKTPLERLLENDSITEEKKKALREKLAQLNPFELKKSLDNKLKAFFAPIELQSNKKRRI